jgi:D-glucuronyl C5-epimerase C-terminus
MSGGRRTAVVLAGCVLAVAGCGGDKPTPPAAPELAGAEPAPRSDKQDRRARMRAARARAAAEEAAWRRTELAEIEDSVTVHATLRRALLTKRIGRRAHGRYRAALAGARKAEQRLTGTRAVEQSAVLSSVEQLAAERRLTPSRLPAVFLNLRRNTRTWTQEPFPVAGERRSFGDDAAVFQYVPGRGMQLHPLATWGKVNWQLRRCLLTRGKDCAERRLRRRIDGLAELPARRGGFVAWEYYYPYAQGTPPWISGMAQATAIQALSRAAIALDAPRYDRVARRALGAFETAPPTGVAVDVAGGRRYVMYSFAPTLQILNGELQAINGLRDAAVLGRSERAARLVARGDRAARAALGGFDTGAWSLYSSAGGEATLAYHQLTTNILAELCRRTEREEYCAAQRRFARYETEPPRIGIAPLRGLWAKRSAPLEFTLSKGSAVRVRVYGPRGVVLARDMQLGRGGHELSWTPPSRGRFEVRVTARGPEGRVGVSGRAVRVALPKPKPKQDEKRRAADRDRRERNPERRGGADPGRGEPQPERRGEAIEAQPGGIG